MASFLTVGLLVFCIVVIANCQPSNNHHGHNGHHGHHGHHDHEHEVDIFNQSGPVPIPGRKGLLNFILLVPQKKKESFCKGYLNAIDHNRNVDVDYGFGYGPGIEIHESGSDSSDSSRGIRNSNETPDVINIPDIPNTQIVYSNNGWHLLQKEQGKTEGGRRHTFPVSLERYCRMFLVTYF